ncbi:MAG: RluA family pseudouridine synthase [Alphaproteobacteria bacterium]
MEKINVQAAPEDEGQRTDRALARLLPQFSRARLQQLMEQGMVTAGGKPVKASARVKTGDSFSVTVPEAVEAEPQPQDIPLDIAYEDEDMLVINKPPGMVVHPGAGNHDGTLVNALLAYCGDQLSGIGGVKRPGIVHRLDKETSGLMAVAKNDAAHKGLSEQLSSRKLKRVYHAIVWGQPRPRSGRIETGFGRATGNRQKMAVRGEGEGKEAITDYETLENFGLIASLVECRLQTGRTHQIRVHMAHIQNWLVGDPVYGRNAIAKFLKLHKVEDKIVAALRDFPRQALHAAQLEFLHPLRHIKVTLKAEEPDDMKTLLALLRKSYSR